MAEFLLGYCYIPRNSLRPHPIHILYEIIMSAPALSDKHTRTPTRVGSDAPPPAVKAKSAAVSVEAATDRELLLRILERLETMDSKTEERLEALDTRVESIANKVEDIEESVSKNNTQVEELRERINYEVGNWSEFLMQSAVTAATHA